MINAPVDQVWNVLTDFDRFPEWNPVIRRVEGRLAVGEAVRMTASSPDGEQPWTCRISRHRAGQEFAWQFTDRHLLLYRGEHTFCVIAIDAHTTRYIDVEAFHGCSCRAAVTFSPPTPERAWQPWGRARETRRNRHHEQANRHPAIIRGSCTMNAVPPTNGSSEMN